MPSTTRNSASSKLIRKNEGMHKVLTDLLIGDLFEEKYEELFAAVDEIAKTPVPLDYGMRVGKWCGGLAAVRQNRWYCRQGRVGRAESLSTVGRASGNLPLPED